MKFHGVLGFLVTEETSPGIHNAVITEKEYTGDILRELVSSDQGEKINPDFKISNRISIIGDSFANEHLAILRYVTWRGLKWAVSSVELVEKRILITIGGVYNG